MKHGQYVITSATGDSRWHETNAKSVNGAKMLASKMYQESYNGSIEVGYCMDDYSVQTVAIKHGYDKWTDC